MLQANQHFQTKTKGHFRSGLQWDVDISSVCQPWHHEKQPVHDLTNIQLKLL